MQLGNFNPFGIRQLVPDLMYNILSVRYIRHFTGRLDHPVTIYQSFKQLVRQHADFPLVPNAEQYGYRELKNREGADFWVAFFAITL